MRASPEKQSKYVITGGPNAGKTSVIDLLSREGYPVLSETSRIVIEVKGIMPWDNQELFCEEFRKMQIAREKKLMGKVSFLDRSLVDPVAYAELDGCRINPLIYENIEQAGYERDVFLFEMLPEYQTDSQRMESLQLALAVHQRMREVYDRLGFRVIDVPLFSPHENESKKMRLGFILSIVASRESH